MKPEEFERDCPGELKMIPEGCYAFVPDLLPPKAFESTSELVNLQIEVALGLGELKGIGTRLPNPHLLIGPLQTREAILSSKLEGTVTTAEELIMIDALPKRSSPRNEAFEVHNYIMALEKGLDRLQELPVGNRLIREIHARLMEGVRGQERSPGEFRRDQNYIAKKGQLIHEARFVPPPVLEMHQCLSDMEKYIHSANAVHSLIRLALVHYQFEAIHPFEDGNGRVGRLLIALLLCDWKILDQPLLYMSSYFEKHEDSYRDLLLAVSQQGAWHEWVKFFLKGLVDQSRDAIVRSDKLLQLQEQYRETIQKRRSSALTLKLVDHLFLSPWTNVSRASKLLGVTDSGAQNNINKLIAKGILYEATGRRRDRIYLAKGILDIVNKDSFDD